ncbi:hypothetical protein B0J17DRAFT_682523 [Rhizoctonia solani]|nr:hypothetical protein B0J17DRAFT_682523 [Rhizoctonia solani]
MLSARLGAYATRSSQALLDIHFIFHPIHTHHHLLSLSDAQIHGDRDRTIFPFLTAAAPRIRSLILMSPPILDCKFCSSVLVTCISNCTPGILTEVSIEAPIILDRNLTIDTPNNEGLVKSNNDAFWLPITVLQLSRSHIPWESKAYHGLTEFRVDIYDTIKLSVLVAIFQCSPQLRLFELQCYEDLVHDDSLLAPIPLDNLEILVLVGVQDVWLGLILQLIAPGLKPLSLSISNPYEHDTQFSCREELQRFIARSNVTRFCANDFKTYSQIANVLSLLPTVQVLALDSFSCHDIAENDTESSSLIIDTLYVIRSRGLSSFAWAAIERLVQRHQVQKLIFWWSDFRDLELGEAGGERVPDNLYTVCPVVKILPDDQPNPTEEWYFRGLHNYFS